MKYESVARHLCSRLAKRGEKFADLQSALLGL
jgi:hypothetical protein